MKVRKMVAAVVLIAITLIPGASQTSRVSGHDLLNTPIDNLELKAANIGLLLSELSARTKVPIGLEVSPQDDLSQTNTIHLQMRRGTLADVLTSIVRQNPLYTWKIQDDVVNVLPLEEGRDPVLKVVLETRLEKFSITRGVSRFGLRQTLSTTPVIKRILTEHQVLSENQSFMSRDLIPLAPKYELEAANVSVSALESSCSRESNEVLDHAAIRRQEAVLRLKFVKRHCMALLVMGKA